MGPYKSKVELIFENIGHLLETQNCSFQNIIKLTVFLKDIGDFDAVNSKMIELLDEPYPQDLLFRLQRFQKM